MKYLNLSEFTSKKHFWSFIFISTCIFAILICPFFLIDFEQYSNHFSFARFFKMLFAALFGVAIGGFTMSTTGVFSGALLKKLVDSKPVTISSTFMGATALTFLGISFVKNSHTQLKNNLNYNPNNNIQFHKNDSSFHEIFENSPTFNNLSQETKKQFLTEKDERKGINEGDRNQELIDSLNEMKLLVEKLKALANLGAEDDYYTLLFKELKYFTFLNYTFKVPKSMIDINSTNTNVDLRSEVYKNPDTKDGKFGLGEGSKEGKMYASNQNIIIKCLVESPLETINIEEEMKLRLEKGLFKSTVLEHNAFKMKYIKGYYYFTTSAVVQQNKKALNLIENIKEKQDEIIGERLAFNGLFVDLTSRKDLMNTKSVFRVSITFNKCTDKNWQAKVKLCKEMMGSFK